MGTCDGVGNAVGASARGVSRSLRPYRAAFWNGMLNRRNSMARGHALQCARYQVSRETLRPSRAVRSTHCARRTVDSVPKRLN